MKFHLLLAAAAAATAAAASAQGPRIAQVSSFDQEVTGVAAAQDGRIFVNFPRWNSDVPVSVAEVRPNGSTVAYPNAEWNSWRNAAAAQIDPRTHFVNVQSVVADKRGSLWVLDPGAPNAEKVLPGAAKLVKIDLASNAVTRIYPFDETIAPPDSYLNDIRFAPDGRHAFMTDSGRGALVVLDLDSGVATRVLDKHPSTMLDPSVQVMTDGRPLRRPDGRQPMFHADSIELSADGEYLLWQALTGKTIYRVPISALTRPDATADLIARSVERVAENRVADGYLRLRDGRLLITAPEDNAVRVMAADGTITPLIQDRRLRWPDSMAELPDGQVLLTTSRIQDNDWFKPDAKPGVATQLWRVRP
ncbi:SMP-30/gluconolactonase/LRE family protein [Sphingomonas endolithica]|uniref:SMP-30/gluconolactonase/LRE family protein n=1 Tax=Sphingomonas endolithica TaxID=2972485 RepID=UPI0021AF1285|nr:major royal jelly family protein [Sphingomonas sp. ZFBP2030]